MKSVKSELKELCFPEIGRRLRAQRTALHLSREDVAESIGVTPKFISDIEYGSKGISLMTLYRLMQLYDMSADFIISGDTAEAGEEETKTVKQIKENILAPLSVCGEEELRCMEQIAHYYVQALKK